MGPHSWFASKILQIQKARRIGIIHVGAHIGQEVNQYEALGLKRQLYIEPMPHSYQALLRMLPKREEVLAFQVACANENARRTMIVSGFDQTHSLAKLKRQVEIHPQHAQIGTIEVDVVRLDDLMASNGLPPENYSLMVVDTQGSELETLKGAEKAVKCVDCIMAEVGTIELYEGMALDHEVDAWLSSRGFSKVDTNWFGPKVNGKSTYGDSLYVRKGL